MSTPAARLRWKSAVPNKAASTSVRSRPIQLQLDTYEPREPSFRAAANANIVSQSAQAAQTAQSAPAVQSPRGYEATSAYADQGQIQLNARIGHTMPVNTSAQSEVQAEQNYTPADFSLKTGVDFQWDDGSLEIRYQMDKLKFDWKIDQGEFKFTPGDIEISVAQKPSITFKYVGGPIYVPRSADPNYEPVDVEA